MNEQSNPTGPLDGPPPYDLRGKDLSRLNLGGRDLTNAQMQGARLFGTVFNGVVSMAGADLTGAQIGYGTDFTGCDLTGTTFGANPDLGSNPLYLTKLIGARVPFALIRLTWRYLDLTDAIIIGLSGALSGLTVSRCALGNLSFAGHDLSGACFVDSILPNVDFTGCTLRDAKFSGSDEMLCDLTSARFVGANLASASFAHCDLTDSDFTRATVIGTAIDTSRLHHTCFDETDWTDGAVTNIRPEWMVRDPKRLTSFRNAKLKVACVLWSDWSCFDLTGASIVDLADSRRWGPGSFKFDHAVLTGLDLREFNLAGVTMTGATVTGTDFSKADLTNAVLCGLQSRCELFRVAAPSDDYTTLLQAWKGGGNAGKIAEIFARHGRPISRVAISKTPAGGMTVIDAPALSTERAKAVYEVSQQTAGDASLFVVADVTPNVFDEARLGGAKLGPDTTRPTVLRGASFNRATMTDIDLGSADLSQINPNEKSADTAPQFDSAVMNTANLSRAVLTGAKLTRTALHKANLIGASLKGADLTGAQLGAVSERFRVAGPKDQQPPPDEYRKLLAALKTQDIATVSALFAGHGIALKPGGVTIDPEVPDRSWTVRDSANQTSYPVVNWTAADNATFLIVSEPASAASLTGAYLANAKLINTNLLGVSATHLQLYGPSASLDGAILDGCKLSWANLSRASLTLAPLYNFDLSNANLIETRFNGADLRNATLSYASLHGTDFTDARMNGANLTSAAVAVPLTDDLAGTFLFTLTGEVSQKVVTDLRAATAPGIPMTLTDDEATIRATIAGLAKGDISPLRRLFAAQDVSLPPTAAISWVGGPDGEAWRVTGGCEYVVWHGIDDDGLLAGPTMLSLRDALAGKAVAGALRWQATVSQDDLPATMWQIFNDNDNPNNLNLGYDTLLAVEEKDALVFYGTALRVQQLGDGDRNTIERIPLRPTQLGETDPASNGAKSRFGPDTICPNGLSLKQNQGRNVPWEQMLRAKEPPTPPTCVPSPRAYCPEVSAAILAAEEIRGAR